MCLSNWVEIDIYPVMSSTSRPSPRNLGQTTSRPFKPFERPGLSQTFRAPLKTVLPRRGIRISIGDRHSMPTSQQLSPNRSFLPTIAGESLSLKTSKLNSSHKLNLSLQGNPTFSDIETPKARGLPGTLKTPRGHTYSSSQPGTIANSMQLPMTPEVALKVYTDSLTSHEQDEILNFAQVYFLGLKANKAKLDPTQPNSGFDDNLGYYKIVLGDHIAYRFEVIQVLGRGSFGQVLRCLDHKRNSIVAIKLIRNKKRFHRQAAIEVKVLQQLRDNDIEDTANCVHFKQYFHFRRHLVKPS